jgi:hypothetical protein
MTNQPTHQPTHQPTNQPNQPTDQPTDQIAVVTHSSFVHYALTNYGHAASTAVQGDLHRRASTTSFVFVPTVSSSIRSQPLPTL